MNDIPTIQQALKALARQIPEHEAAHADLVDRLSALELDLRNLKLHHSNVTDMLQKRLVDLERAHHPQLLHTIHTRLDHQSSSIETLRAKIFNLEKLVFIDAKRP